MTDARETRRRNLHEIEHSLGPIWCEKLARERSCCKSVWHRYKFLARVNSHEFFVSLWVSRTCVMGLSYLVTRLSSQTHTQSVTEGNAGHWTLWPNCTTQNSFLIYYFNDFSACWHVAAIYHCPHVGADVPWYMRNTPKFASELTGQSSGLFFY